MLPSFQGPNIKNGKKIKGLPVTLPRIETNDSQLDMSLLDVMGIDDFLSLLKNKTDNSSKELWKETCALALQLKASRELLSIGSNLCSNKTNKSILDRLVESSYVILNADRVYLMELDSCGKNLVVTHSREKNAIGLKISKDIGVEGDVVSRKVCANVPDVSQDARYIPALDSKLGQKTRCLVCAPIIADGVVLGVIQAANKKSTANTPRTDTNLSFNANEALLLGFIAANAGLALQQSSCTEDNQSQCHTLPAHVSVETFRANDPPLQKRLLNFNNDESIRRLMGRAYDKLKAERVSMFTYNPTTKTLMCTISQDAQGISIPSDKGFAGMCFTRLSLVNIPDAESDVRHNKEVDNKVGFTTRNVLCAPIVNGEGTAVGVIQAINKKNGAKFTVADETEIVKVSDEMVNILKDKALSAPDDLSANSSGLTTTSEEDIRLARCVTSMMLCTTLAGLASETEAAVKTLTGCDFTGMYTLEGGNLVRILPSAKGYNGHGKKKLAARSNSPTSFVSPTPSVDTFATGGKEEFKMLGETLSGFKPGADPYLDNLAFVDVPIQMKQALQFSNIVEFSLPMEQPPDGSEPKYLLPGLPVKHALIVPVSTKVSGYQPGSCVLVVGQMNHEEPITGRTREILVLLSEYFNQALGSVSRKLSHDEATRSLRSQFNIVNNSLGVLRDFVVLLTNEGKFMACNKPLEELLGGHLSAQSTSSKQNIGMTEPAMEGNATTNSTPTHHGSQNITPPSMPVTEGQHYTEFLSNANSPELCRDIATALNTGKSRCLDKVKFFSAINPHGFLVDYQIVILPNAEEASVGPDHDQGTPVSRMRKTVKSPSEQSLPVTLEEKEGLGNFIVVLIIHLENFHHQKTLGPVTTPHAQLMNISNLSLSSLETDSAHGVVDAATSIVNNVRSSYSLTPEIEENLKSITMSLNQASRKLSIHGTNHSATSAALQVASLSLVSAEEAIPHDLFEWNFNVLDTTDGMLLCNIIGKLFESLFDLGEMGIDSSTLARYIVEVGKNYHDRPFHNLQHSACVTHFTYKLIDCSKAAEHLTSYQLFAILIAAVVHDVDHPGNTNLFEVNSASELALRYNDQAVLENHHCSTAFRLMRKSHAQVLAPLPKPVATEIRKTIISCVMATDMAVHFDLIDETKRKAIDGWNFSDAKDQLFFGKILLHAADLSNPVRPFHMTKEWARRISLEFNDQVEREQALEMPVLGFMMTPDEKAFCKNETGFASFVVGPMWRALSMAFPQLNFLVAQLDSNLQTWKEILQKIEAEEAEAAQLAKGSGNATPSNATPGPVT